jgi:hypothetical protein
VRLRADLSMRGQCALSGPARSGSIAPDPENLALMRWIAEQNLATPFVVRPGESRAPAADDG